LVSNISLTDLLVVRAVIIRIDLLAIYGLTSRYMSKLLVVRLSFSVLISVLATTPGARNDTNTTGDNYPK